MEIRVKLSKKINSLVILLIILTLACGGIGNQQGNNQAPSTKTPLPTFTPSPTLTLQPLLPTPTPVIEVTPTDTPTLVVVIDTPTSVSEVPPTDTPVIDAPTIEPTSTAIPLPPIETPVSEATPTDTPTPEPIIKYVLAGTNREFNCDFTYIYGSVKNANNFGIPDVEVRALGIHDTTGQDFTTRTDAEGNYEIFRIPLDQLLAAQWAVMVMENGREVSERFHWASTPVCESDDLGHSQVLRVDWKLIE